MMIFLNSLLVNDEFFKETVDDLTAKMKAYNVKRKAEEIRNKNMNDIHQKKLDDLSMINTQASVNLQNELVKGIIFQK